MGKRARAQRSALHTAAGHRQAQGSRTSMSVDRFAGWGTAVRPSRGATHDGQRCRHAHIDLMVEVGVLRHMATMQFVHSLNIRLDVSGPVAMSTLRGTISQVRRLTCLCAFDALLRIGQGYTMISDAA